MFTDVRNLCLMLAALRWWFVMSLALFMASSAALGAVEETVDRAFSVDRPLIVVEDRAYPPFAFLDDQGQPQGISIDIWRAWSARTQTPIEFRLMAWDDALQAVRSGQADAVSGIFRTAARERDFTFNTTGIKIATGIFFHQRVTGVRRLEDLKSFRVGVVSGDSAEELIQDKVEALRVFPGADEMVSAALAGKINVFVADEPTAWYYLARHAGGSEFRQAENKVAVNFLCSAVRINDNATLRRIQAGWDSLSQGEIDDMVASWTGRSLVARLPWGWIGGCASGVLAIAGGILIWNTVLRRQIARATAELAERNTHLAVAHEEMHRTRALVQAVIDALPMSIWAFDREGRLILQNRFSVSLIGDHRGTALADIRVPTPVIDSWRAALAPGLRGEMQTQEGWQQVNAGDARRLETRSAPVLLDGDIIAVVGAQVDITERYQTEEMRHRTSKMVALGKLASGVAHDFNNMLAGIMGYADLLSFRVQDDKSKLYAARIADSVVQAKALTSRLLAFARQGSVAPEVYDGHVSIMAALDLFAATRQAKLVVERDLQAQGTSIRGFPALFYNAILNLCFNAGDAMPNGGRLRIASTVVTLDPAASAALAPYAVLSGDYLHVSVADNGSGMEPDVLARCLEPLYSTKGDHGTGLGLPGVHGCMLDHHGALRIDSNPGSGTTVKMWLPLVDSQHSRSADGLILVVDDDGRLRQATIDLVEQFGFRAMGFGDGEAVVDWVRLHPDEPTVALLDMHMPKLGGAGTFSALRSLIPDLPVIVTSGSGGDVIVEDLLRRGLAAVLRKPMHGQELFKALAQIMNARGGQNAAIMEKQEVRDRYAPGDD